jgi:hypothetical protein
MTMMFRRYRYIGAYSAVALLGVVCFYWLGNTVFQIEHIEVSGSGIEVAVDQRRIAKNLIFFPVDTTTQEILSQNPLVDHVELQKKYPHTLVIIATKRTPVARFPSQGIYWQLDKTGMVLGPDNESQRLPGILIDVPAVQIGQKVSDARIIAGTTFLGRVLPFLRVTSIEQYDTLSLLAKSEVTNILIPQKADQSAVADTLQTMLSGFRIKGMMPNRIDLRFDKPVVIF